MPRPLGSTKTPSYRHHRPSGQAVVTIDCRDYYLGPWKSKGSRTEYDRLISEWLANDRRMPVADADLSIAELVNAYWKYARRYYEGESGRGELGSFRLALKVLRRLYGPTLIKDFGPRALKAVRHAMIEDGWSRKYINAQLRRLRRVFLWGVEEEMVPGSIPQALAAVQGLRKGKTTAREAAPVRPVDVGKVEAVLAHVSPQVRSIIRLQQITGMRPGEAVIMRGCDIDQTGELWTYKPARHKTESHGHERAVYLGPQAQEIIRPFLKPDAPLAYIFCPADAEARRHAKQREERQTPVQPSQVKRAQRSKRRKRRRGPRDRYDVASYRRAIARACETAFGMPAEYRAGKGDTAEQKAAKSALRSKWHEEHGWHPHQLRHNAATTLRKEYGLEAAQVILGHKTLSVTEIYAEKNVEAAQKIMAAVG